jgi:uncharacterized membrane protein
LTFPALPTAPEFCVVARRNSSLGRRERWLVFGALATVSLGVAALFVLAGAWPVLPYSVLEVALLAVAFRYVERRADDWERLTICGDRVVVERSVAGLRQRREFNRYWLRVECVEMRAWGLGAASPVLKLCFAGESWEFGDTLPAQERLALAKDLRRLVGTH